MPVFDVFISYSTKDKTIADAACAALEAARIRCWIAPRDIRPGVEWGAAIVDAIDRCRVMVLIFSSNANASPQIRNELVQAVNRGVPIIPLRVESVSPSKSLAFYMAAVHWLDALTPPLEKHLMRLAEAVNAFLQIDEDSTSNAAKRPADPLWPQLRAARASMLLVALFLMVEGTQLTLSMLNDNVGINTLRDWAFILCAGIGQIIAGALIIAGWKWGPYLGVAVGAYRTSESLSLLFKLPGFDTYTSFLMSIHILVIPLLYGCAFAILLSNRRPFLSPLWSFVIFVVAHGCLLAIGSYYFFPGMVLTIPPVIISIVVGYAIYQRRIFAVV
jgi:hypothetical protein